MHIQDPQRQTAVVAAAPVENARAADGERGERTTPLRVDAQRNLEHVLRAAREVFGEVGYGAPMEEVARRARVGVGTVYRRFPSKDVLVRRIAAEETQRLTEHARAALSQEEDSWEALARFLRYAVDSGAGRLLPPEVLRAGAASLAAGPVASGLPQQRQEMAEAGSDAAAGATGSASDSTAAKAAEASAPVRLPAQEAAVTGLLDAVGQLVERARAAGKLRPDVTVADVLLVIATAAPSLPDAAQQAAVSARVLDILLDGLRARSDGEADTAGPTVITAETA